MTPFDVSTTTHARGRKNPLVKPQPASLTPTTSQAVNAAFQLALVHSFLMPYGLMTNGGGIVSSSTASAGNGRLPRP